MLTDGSDLSDFYHSKPWQRDLSNQVAEALNARKDWLGARWSSKQTSTSQDAVRLLDYACGTGSITRALGPFVDIIRGIDLSENSVVRYNETARSSGLSEEQAHAVVGDLCGETVPVNLQTPDLEGFDISVIGLGFHHFEDPARSILRLGERLKAGSGVLVIVDFLPFTNSKTASAHHHHHHGEKGDFPEMSHTIKHNGFTSEQMQKLFQYAGFEDFGFVTIPEPAVMELQSGRTERTLFIAKGRLRADA